jgi:transcription elongation factor GreA
MKIDHEIMTTVGKRKIEEELEHLIKVEREAIKKAISEARALGDLKENSEYHSAKEKQSHIEGRISELQHKINTSKVVDVSELSGDVVKFGATVTLLDVENDAKVCYQIVGIDEADKKANKISYLSPLGGSLIGKSEGDSVIVKAPKGDIEFEIEKVQFV